MWAPQPRQKILLDCPYKEIFFGGARGGGKSNGILGKYGVKASKFKHVNAIFFRKELPQADDLIEEAKEIYLPLNAWWRDQRKMFEFPNGSRIRFRPLESETDAEKYQGQNLTDCAVEEAGNYPDPKPIFKLFGALRSKHGVPTQLILTANPGGVGHLWIKERYIDPAPLGLKPILAKLPNGKEHKYIYIPSKVNDNRVLLAKNPDYINNLYLVGSEQLVKAWLEGDWSIIEGAYFPEFSIPKHVIKPFEIPKHWKSRVLGYDHGHHSNFYASWYAVSTGKDDKGKEFKLEDGRHVPKGCVVFYREYFGKQTPIADIASEILRLQGDEDPLSVADPSIFNSEGGDSVGDLFAQNGLIFQPADNERLAGWAQWRRRLKPNNDPNTMPMVLIFENLSYLIKTLPAAPIDKKKPEDLDTQFDDHALDGSRYGLMENPVESLYHDYVSPHTKGVINVQNYLTSIRRERHRPRV